MATEHTRFTVEVKGVTETVRAFSTYGKEANNELRDAAQLEVNKVAPLLVSAMNATSKQGALVATSIVARRDRYPTIRAGGAATVRPKKTKKGSRARAGDIFFGAEFGGRGRRTTQQFRPHKGTEGYAFYPTLRRHTADIIDGYRKALDRLAEKWGDGGRK